jgi:hypothetical protein
MLPVYVDKGAKRTFACAVDWPGWCRSGSDETAALRALLAYAPRYATVASRAELLFTPPATLADLRVVERVAGDALTDRGTPNGRPQVDRADVDDAALERLRALVRAAWRALDDAVRTARAPLATVPRGRSLDAILRHVRQGEELYLSALGWKVLLEPADEAALRRATRGAVLRALAASARGEIASIGPRGGVRWRPRYFARRLAWHALDHAWEIEDRSR